MDRLKEKKTEETSGVRRRRFEPSSDGQPGPLLREVGENPTKTRIGRTPIARLVAARRAELGLTQEDLALRMGVSQAAVARIEEGHPPSTDALKQLAEVLPPEEGKGELLHWIERELHWRSPQFRRQGARAPQGSLDLRLRPLDGHWRSLEGRWLWGGGLAMAVLAAVVVIVAGPFSDSGGGPAAQPAEVVAAPPAAPVAAKPQKATKNADKAKKADGAAPPVTGSEESSSAPAPTSSDSGSSGDAGFREPVSAPVAPPPRAPTSQPSNDPRPGILHGIEVGAP